MKRLPGRHTILLVPFLLLPLSAMAAEKISVTSKAPITMTVKKQQSLVVQGTTVQNAKSASVLSARNKAVKGFTTRLSCQAPTRKGAKGRCDVKLTITGSVPLGKYTLNLLDGKRQVLAAGQFDVKVDPAVARKQQVAKQKAAQVARQKAAQVAKQKAAQVARQKAAQVVKQKAAQVARQKAAQVAKQKAAQVARQKAAQIAKQKAAQAARQKAAQVAKQKAAGAPIADGAVRVEVVRITPERTGRARGNVVSEEPGASVVDGAVRTEVVRITPEKTGRARGNVVSEEPGASVVDGAVRTEVVRITPERAGRARGNVISEEPGAPVVDGAVRAEVVRITPERTGRARGNVISEEPSALVVDGAVRAEVVRITPERTGRARGNVVSGFNVAVQNLAVSSINAKAKDDITVTFDIVASGSGTYDIPWKINADNDNVEDGTIEVTAGSTVQVTETIGFYNSGEYEIDVELNPSQDSDNSDNKSEGVEILLSDWPGWMCQLKDPTIRALNQWKATTVLQEVLITGPLASHGKVTGTTLRAYLNVEMLGIEPSDITLRGVYNVLKNKLADVIDVSLFGSSFTVNGQIWYPTFAMVPSVVAPSTNNVPSPLSSIVSSAGVNQSLLSLTIFSSGLNDEKNWPNAQDAVEDFISWYVDVINFFIQTAIISEVTGQGATAAVPNGVGGFIPGPVIAGTGQGNFLAGAANFTDRGTWPCEYGL